MAKETALAAIRKADKIEIPTGRAYLVMGPNVWGKAFSATQAWQNATKPTRFIVFDAPPDAYVDGLGSITYRPSLYYEPDAEAAERKAEGFVPIGYGAREIARFGLPPKKTQD